MQKSASLRDTLRNGPIGNEQKRVGVRCVNPIVQRREEKEEVQTRRRNVRKEREEVL